MNKKIVITGAPGTGKTSIINQLAKQHQCKEEISRAIIAEQLNTGGNITPWGDLIAFSGLVIEKRLKQYHAHNHELCFFDRGILDSIAYLKYGKAPINNKWLTVATQTRYHNDVFITPPWEEIHCTDQQRKENFDEALRIHDCIVNTYEAYNYNLIEIPKLNIDERANFILSKIEK
jgi:predicted ATPase